MLNTINYSNKKTNNNYYVYAWVLETTYIFSNVGTLSEQTGSSYPCRFEIINDENGFKVVNCDIPRDGSYYYEDIEKYFPGYVREKIDAVHEKNGTFKELSDDILNQAKYYFNIK